MDIKIDEVLNMKYRVFNTIANRYVTDEEEWILKPDGRLAVNEDGDEIGYPHCVAEFSTGLLDMDGDEIFENDFIVVGEKILLVHWNNETFGWQASTIYTEFNECKDIDLRQIAAEVAEHYKMTIKIIGNTRENQNIRGLLKECIRLKIF